MNQQLTSTEENQMEKTIEAPHPGSGKLLPTRNQMIEKYLEVELLTLILGNLEDLSLNQISCNDEEKTLILQLQKTMNSWCKVIYTEVQKLRSETQANHEKITQEIRTLNKNLEAISQSMKIVENDPI